ncbi:MAG TPA: nucleotidyltransferase domain-containing protein [Candidatus Hydrogenedentes bacterium]|nr:nucleotidyltransferase domain-containing protein [Candidatus Hydrogenedentota bacterium]
MSPQNIIDSEQMLQEIVKRIRDTVKPLRIVLFGSRARGASRETSDFDVLVINDSQEERFHRAAPLYRLLADLPVEVDIMVYTPSEVEEWSEVKEAFVTTALREGKVLYEG